MHSYLWLIYSEIHIVAKEKKKRRIGERTPQAVKRARQSEKRRKLNASQRSMLRTYIKKVVQAIEAKTVDAAKEAFKVAQPFIDQAARKNLIHKNKAARIKSRLHTKIKALDLASA
ncbi:MAG: 30S ribosomal protein S20 [Gammaproteobacteria bacterium]|nr:30S ribosomal protein S20 [Gammaproteobacteria bacterium]